MFRPFLALLAIWSGAGVALAQVPRVVADIAPVQSLVAQVMEGVGEPDLILRPGLPPHASALRPSQARAISRADLVVWVGPDLTPWLAASLDTLAPDAARLELLALPGTARRRFADGMIDPHAWLDPGNGRLWLDRIAGALAEIDSDNAARYRANAAAGAARIEAAAARAEALLSGLRDVPFITSHAAYGYFEARFGLRDAGAVAAGDATAPGAARLTRLRETVREQGVGCAFAEPGADQGLLRAVGPGLRIVTLDPLGAGLVPGPDLYPALLEQIAAAMADCLGDG